MRSGVAIIRVIPRAIYSQVLCDLVLLGSGWLGVAFESSVPDRAIIAVYGQDYEI